MAGANVFEVTDATFDKDVLQSEQPVLVDFWAVWCGPCKAIAPIVDDLATAYLGKLKVVKVNVDQNSATPLALRHSGHSRSTLLQRRQGRGSNRRVCA